MSRADQILAQIKQEVISSLKKHPKWPSDPFYALAILGEEYGEVVKAVVDRYSSHLNNPGSLEEIRKELYQVAAMCVRMLDGLGSIPAAVRIDRAINEQFDQSKLVKDTSLEAEAIQRLIEQQSKTHQFLPSSIPLVLNYGPAKATVVDAKGNEHTLGEVRKISNPNSKFSYIDKRLLVLVNAVQLTPKLWVAREKGEVPTDWDKLNITRTHGTSFGNHTLVFTGKANVEKHPTTNIAKIGDWVITRSTTEDRWLGRGIDFERVTVIHVEVLNDDYFKFHFAKIG